MLQPLWDFEGRTVRFVGLCRTLEVIRGVLMNFGGLLEDFQ